MLRRLAITVTQKHINAGIRNDGNWCPIALALKDVLTVDGVTADPCYIAIGLNTNGILSGNYKPPREMTAFMNAFDDGREVQPLTFFLDVIGDFLP